MQDYETSLYYEYDAITVTGETENGYVSFASPNHTDNSLKKVVLAVTTAITIISPSKLVTNFEVMNVGGNCVRMITGTDGIKNSSTCIYSLIPNEDSYIVVVDGSDSVMENNNDIVTTREMNQLEKSLSQRIEDKQDILVTKIDCTREVLETKIDNMKTKIDSMEDRILLKVGDAQTQSKKASTASWIAVAAVVVSVVFGILNYFKP